MSGPDDVKARLEDLAKVLREAEREIQAIRGSHPTYGHALHDAEALLSTAAEELEHAAKREP